MVNSQDTTAANLGSFLTEIAQNTEAMDFLKSAFGIDFRPALEDDGKIDEIEQKGILGTIGNFLVSIGVIDAPEEKDAQSLATEEELDNETATGLLAFRSIGNASDFSDVMNRAVMHYVSQTHGVDKATLEDAYTRGQNFDLSPPSDEFLSKAGTPDESRTFDEAGNLVTQDTTVELDTTAPDTQVVVGAPTGTSGPAGM